MTTTNYTPGTIIVHADEAHRILQINNEGHARTISDNALELIINTNTLNPETTKVITNATPETWINYITKAHTARNINKELTRDKYNTEFRNVLASWRNVMNPEVVPTISLLNEATSRAAVQSYMENIIASINEGKNKMETQYAEFLATVPAIMEETPAPKFSIPEPDAGYAVIKGYKLEVGMMYSFEVDVPAKDPEYPGDTERVNRYAKVTRVTKTRAYLTFEDETAGYASTAGSKSSYDLMVTIGEESYPVTLLSKYNTDNMEGIQETHTYAVARKNAADQISEAYGEMVANPIEENPFWAKLFFTWGYRARTAEGVIHEATKNLTSSKAIAAKVTAPIHNLLEQLTVFEQ